MPIAVATSSPWKSKTEIRVLESSSTYRANHLRARARRQRSIRTNRNLANARAVASGGGGLPTTVTLATAPYGSVTSAPSLAPTQPPAPSAQTPVSSQADRPGYLGNIARVSGHWSASYQSGDGAGIATLHTTQPMRIAPIPRTLTCAGPATSSTRDSRTPARRLQATHNGLARPCPTIDHRA